MAKGKQVNPSESANNGCTNAFTLAFRPLTRVFWIFGFDLGSTSVKRSLVKTILRFPIRLILLFLAFNSSDLSFFCVKNLLSAKKNYKSECVPATLNTNVVDVVFAMICFLNLVVHEKRLATIFTSGGNEILEQLGFESGKKPARKWLFFACFLAFLSFVFSAMATSGLIAFSKFPSLIIGRPIGLLSRNFDQYCVLPLRIFSTLFCCLYALACFKLRFCMRKLAEKDSGFQSLEEFEERFTKIRRLIGDLDAAFSDALPLLYLCRFLSIGIWIEFVLTKPGLKDSLRFLAVFQHALQLFCLIVPPILLNGTVKTSLDIQVTERKRSIQGGVYIPYETSSSTSSNVNLMMMQLTTSPPRMTAGGCPISTWTIVMAVLISWLYLGLSGLDMVTKQGFANHPPQTGTFQTATGGSNFATRIPRFTTRMSRFTTRATTTANVN